MKKICFFGDWGESSSSLLKRYSKQTPNNSGRWENIIGVDNALEADYFVIMDGPSPQELPYPSMDKVIYFQREPINIRSHPWIHEDYEGVFYNGSYKNCHNVTTWWIDKDFNELVNLKKPTITKKLSTVTSGKYSQDRYKQRVDLIKRLTDKFKEIDVYGRGINNYIDNSVYKGELNYSGNCKFKGHYGYDYSLILENTIVPNSWTEKPADALLSWSFPIYGGDTNFNQYFPQGSFYKLEDNLQNQNINDIIELINKPINMTLLEEARNNVLFKWNIWPTIKRIIDEKS